MRLWLVFPTLIPLSMALISTFAVAQGTQQAPPKNIDNALSAPISLNANQEKLAALLASLRDMTQTNMAINWNALAQAGLKRDTPVELHLKDVPFEQVLKTLLEILPAPSATPAQRPNYTVGDNTLSITTNAELGKGNVPRITDFAHGLSYTLEPAFTPETRDQNARLIEQVLRAELLRAGESLDAKPAAGSAVHALAIKEATLAATLSGRGQSVLDRALALLNAPLKVGQLAAGTQLTSAARKTQEALKPLAAAHAGDLLPTLAAHPEQYRDKFNLALLPGTAEELARNPGKPDLASAINDGGVLLIGPRQTLRNRTVLAVYDLRDLIRRLNFKNTKKPQPSPADYQAAILQVIQTNIHPAPPGEQWGTLEDLAKSPSTPSCLVPYNGLLIVFATPETHRTLAAALQDMYK